MRVELRDEARDDLVDGAVFYGGQATGLDEYFLGCLRADLTKLVTTFGIHELYRGISQIVIGTVSVCDLLLGCRRFR